VFGKEMTTMLYSARGILFKRKLRKSGVVLKRIYLCGDHTRESAYRLLNVNI